MSNTRYQSWGRYPKVTQDALWLYWCDVSLPIQVVGDRSFLPFSNGRSYGDVCLNDGDSLLDCLDLNRFISFNLETGVLSCETGVLLYEILQVTVHNGWFLPMTPGTQFLTVGGASANDVHGKNPPQGWSFRLSLKAI